MDFSDILVHLKSTSLNVFAAAACSGGFTTTTRVTLLSPGGVSSNYRNNLDCVWTINVPLWYKVCMFYSVDQDPTNSLMYYLFQFSILRPSPICPKWRPCTLTSLTKATQVKFRLLSFCLKLLVFQYKSFWYVH